MDLADRDYLRTLDDKALLGLYRRTLRSHNELKNYLTVMRAVLKERGMSQ